MAEKQKAKKIKRPRGWLRLLASIIALPVIFVLWQYVASRVQQPEFLPSPGQVFLELLQPSQDLAVPGSILSHLAISALRVSIGFLAAALIALPLGILAGFMQFLRGFIDPFIALLRPLCPIVWLPFAAAAFKMKTVTEAVGIQPPQAIFGQLTLGVVFVVFWGAFFPMVVNTADAVSASHRRYLRLTAKLDLTKLQAFRSVYLPAATPMILSGIKQGIAMAWFVLVIAEMLPGTRRGLGFLLTQSTRKGGMVVAVAAMVVISVVCVVMGMLAASVVSRLFKPPKKRPAPKVSGDSAREKEAPDE